MGVGETVEDCRLCNGIGGDCREPPSPLGLGREGKRGSFLEPEAPRRGHAEQELRSLSWVHQAGAGRSEGVPGGQSRENGKQTGNGQLQDRKKHFPSPPF